MLHKVTYYFAVRPDGEGFFGWPEPASGERVRFDATLLLAARARRAQGQVDRGLTGRDGLVIHEDPRDVLIWPCRLWQVTDVDGEIRLQPSNPWFRTQAFTVQRELPNWMVFGERGEGIAEVIEQARHLTEAKATVLGELANELIPTPDPALDRIPKGRIRTLGHSINRLNQAVDEAARDTGLPLFEFDESDGVDFLADRSWRVARSVAAGALRARGSASPPVDLVRLSSLWREVAGNPPPRTPL